MVKSTFKIGGPYPVPTTQTKTGRDITSENGRTFWEQYPKESLFFGCYVFGMRGGKGWTPSYAGQATNTFKQEVFNPGKLEKFNTALHNTKKGSPILYLVFAPSKNGPRNRNHIKQVEDYLIRAVVNANPKGCQNKTKIKPREWGIAGVSRGGKGSRSAKNFRIGMEL